MGCEFKGNKEKIMTHVEDCKYVYTKCPLCKTEYRKMDSQKHNDECEEASRKCFFCEEKFKEKEFFDHNNRICSRKYYEFANKTNIDIVHKYSRNLIKMQKIEEKINKFSQTKNVNSLRSDLEFSDENTTPEHKKKIFNIIKEDKDKLSEENKSNYSVTVEKEKLLFKNDKNHLSQNNSNVNNSSTSPSEKVETSKKILWNNGKTILKNENQKESITTSLNFPFENDFEVTIKIRKLEGGTGNNNKSVIGFSLNNFYENSSHNHQNFHTKINSIYEWALKQDGVIIEALGIINNQHYNELSFCEGDIIHFTYFDKNIRFYINHQENDYQCYYNAKSPIFLTATLCRLGDEIELIDNN
jgi:hypothetical protein